MWKEYIKTLKGFFVLYICGSFDWDVRFYKKKGCYFISNFLMLLSNVWYGYVSSKN